MKRTCVQLLRDLLEFATIVTWPVPGLTTFIVTEPFDRTKAVLHGGQAVPVIRHIRPGI